MNLIRKFYSRLPVIREMKQIRNVLSQLRSEFKGFESVRLLEFELKDHARYGDPKRLLRHAFQVSSSSGEDGIIQEIFRRVNSAGRVFVEIGAGDGTENNTSFLLSLGWTGFWLDAQEEFLNTIRKRQDLNNGCVRGLAAFVTKENIATLFAQLEVPTEFDLLSIDVDQNTYHVWEGLATYKPRVVVIEYNASLPPGIDWKVHYEPNRVWDGSINFGASLKALELLGKKLGYCLVGCEFCGANAFFVRDDLVAPELFSEPFTAENHFEPPRYALANRLGHLPAVLDRATSKR
jgi:hypothetical protein